MENLPNEPDFKPGDVVHSNSCNREVTSVFLAYGANEQLRWYVRFANKDGGGFDACHNLKLIRRAEHGVKEMLKYAICAEYSENRLMDTVRSFVEDGWKLLGNITINEKRFYQTMIKE